MTVDPPTDAATAAGPDRARLVATTIALGVLVIVAVAAILRFVDLPARGPFDADQGHDMIVLRDLVQHGELPLLGPPTSIGDFHHGMVYYLLLAPAAAVSGADPVAVTAWIALGGVLAVAVTGWLAWSIAGPVAGLAAALLMAVSATAVQESTFIWNPNLIALSSSIALAGAWHAWHARRPRWWVVAGAGAVVTMQCHVLGVILTPVIAALLVADLRRRLRSGDGPGRRSVALAAVAWIAIAAISYVPLAIHELQTDGSELRALIAYLTGGGGPASIGLAARIPIVGLRVLGWPLAGLITDAPLGTGLVATLVVAITIWRGWLAPVATGAGEPGSRGVDAPDSAEAVGAGASREERIAVRWLGLGLLWTVLALAIGAPGLATVVQGLPNDHYHAFADPMVFALIGIGVAALARLRPRGAPAAIGPIAALVVVVLLGGWNLVNQPPAIAADGGWPAAQEAAERVFVSTAGDPVAYDSLPAAKSADALRFPLEQLTGAGDTGPVVVPGGSPTAILCDALFDEAFHMQCGGPAEDGRIAVLAQAAGVPTPTLVDRFEAAPGRWISVYQPE